jgi:glycosyltransferase involved in cell wall biosynthesis
MWSCVIVVPCYNEASRLDTAAFLAFADRTDVRFLFVDDGSTDSTSTVLEQLKARRPDRIDVRRLPKNSGKAEAVRAGLIEAGRQNPDYVGFWDADLATPLDEILAFRQILDQRAEIEMVFGSRVKLLGRSVDRRPTRHYLGRVFATAAAAVLGIAVYDTQCGAKLFRVTPGFLERLEEPFIGGWIFDVELIAREIRARRRTELAPVTTVIFEYPLMSWRDVSGSKIKAIDWFKVSVTLGRIWVRYRLGFPR